MIASYYRSGLLLLVGLAAVLVLSRFQAPWWALGLVVGAQVLVVLAANLDLLQGRFSRWAVGIVAFLLLGLLALPWLSVSTSPHEPDPVWRIPPPQQDAENEAERDEPVEEG